MTAIRICCTVDYGVQTFQYVARTKQGLWYCRSGAGLIVCEAVCRFQRNPERFETEGKIKCICRTLLHKTGTYKSGQTKTHCFSETGTPDSCLRVQLHSEFWFWRVPFVLWPRNEIMSAPENVSFGKVSDSKAAWCHLKEMWPLQNDNIFSKVYGVNCSSNKWTAEWTSCLFWSVRIHFLERVMK